jgi:hypothetical protein
MNQLGPHPILFSERLPTGVMVHFEEGVSVFFSARFLFEQREVQPNQIFLTDDGTFAHGGERGSHEANHAPETTVPIERTAYS